MSSFVSVLYTEIVNAFSSQTATMATNFANKVQPLYVACVGLYVVWVIYKINNQGGVILTDIMNQVALIVLVGAFSFGGSYYTDSIIPFVQNSGDELAKAIGGKGTSNSVDTIDTIVKAFDNALLPYYKEWEEIGILDKLNSTLRIGLSIIILEACKLIFSIAVAVNLILAKIMVNLLLTVGILFVGFALFPSTRNMFQSFTGLCFNYILLNALYSAAVIMVCKFLESRLGGVNGAPVDYVSILVGTLIIVFALNQIPTLVSSLTGGVGISPFTAGGMFGAAAGLMRMGLRGAGGLFRRDGATRNFLQGKRSAAQKGESTDSLPKRWKKRIDTVKNIGNGKAGA